MMAFVRSLETGFLGELVSLKGQTHLGLSNLGPLVGALALVCSWHIRRLQGFALGVTASVLSILLALWLFPMGFLLGLGTLPLGAMALFILCQKETRAAFRAQEELDADREPSTADSRSGFGLAVASAALALLSVAITPIYGATASGMSSASGSAGIILAITVWLYFSAGRTSVMLGWLALWAMRRSGRYARGLGYAVFGISLMPILSVFRYFNPGTSAYLFQPELESSQIPTTMLLGCLICGLLAWAVSAYKSRLDKSGSTSLHFVERLCSRLGIVVLVFAATLMVRFPPKRAQSSLGSEYSGFFFQNHRHVAPRPESKPASFAANLPQGSLELQAVSDPERQDWTCWLPDGTPWCSQRMGSAPASFVKRRTPGTVPKFLSSSQHGGDRDRERIFYLAVQGKLAVAPDRVRSECYVTNHGTEQLCAESRFWHRDRKNYSAVVANVPGEATVARLRLGMPAATWEETDAAWVWAGDPRKLRPKSIRHAGEDWEIGIRDVEPIKEGLAVTFTCPLRWNGVPRLVALDDLGKAHEPEWPWGEVGNAPQEALGHRISSRLLFAGLDAAHLKELRFQIQPYVWAEFRNVSLVPDHHTEVQAVGVHGPERAAQMTASGPANEQGLEPPSIPMAGPRTSGPGIVFRAAGDNLIMESPRGTLTAQRIELGVSNAVTATGSNVTYEMKGSPKSK
jgi:hypothetical protein